MKNENKYFSLANRARFEAFPLASKALVKRDPHNIQYWKHFSNKNKYLNPSILSKNLIRPSVSLRRFQHNHPFHGNPGKAMAHNQLARQPFV